MCVFAGIRGMSGPFGRLFESPSPRALAVLMMADVPDALELRDSIRSIGSRRKTEKMRVGK